MDKTNSSKYIIPFSSSTVSAGFPSPAQDSFEERINILDHIIKHPNSTFLVKAKGDSMTEKGIQDGDILIVDKSLTPYNNSIVIAFLDGEFTVKRFYKCANKVTLFPANSNYKPIEICENDDFLIWGVVTYVIHKCI